MKNCSFVCSKSLLFSCLDGLAKKKEAMFLLAARLPQPAEVTRKGGVMFTTRQNHHLSNYEGLFLYFLI
jgi:hypothetical protein